MGNLCPWGLVLVSHFGETKKRTDMISIQEHQFLMNSGQPGGYQFDLNSSVISAVRNWKNGMNTKHF